MAEASSQIDKTLKNWTGIALREARAAARLTQAEAAKGLSVDTQTVSRWERGERRIKAEDFQRAIDWYLSQTVTNETGRTVLLGKNVSRGTLGKYFMPADVLSEIRQFERNAIRWGATDFEVDLVNVILELPVVMRLLQTGGGDAELGVESQLAEFQAFAAGLTKWLRTRVTNRLSAEAAPIKPKDLPAAEEKFRAGDQPRRTKRGEAK